MLDCAPIRAWCKGLKGAVSERTVLLEPTGIAPSAPDGMLPAETSSSRSGASSSDRGSSIDGGGPGRGRAAPVKSLAAPLADDGRVASAAATCDCPLLLADAAGGCCPRTMPIARKLAREVIGPAGENTIPLRSPPRSSGWSESKPPVRASRPSGCQAGPCACITTPSSNVVLYPHDCACDATRQ